MAEQSAHLAEIKLSKETKTKRERERERERR